MKFRSIMLCAALATTVAATAVPARRGVFTLTQPDGTEVKVQRLGDEFSHVLMTADNVPLLDIDNTLYYATLGAGGNVVSTGVKAVDAGARTAAEAAVVNAIDRSAVRDAIYNRNLGRARARRIPQHGMGLSTTGFPSRGDVRGLVILVEYSDVKFRLDDPKAYFDAMLNEEGFSQYGGTGSARDYFLKSSNGLFVPHFDVYGPVTLPNKMSYYGGNDYYGNDKAPEEMVIDAAELLDDVINFKDYDTDNNGIVDNVYIFYAGLGEASYGSANTVWPHSWDITAATNTPIMHDGVRLDHYACSNEWEQNRPDGIGTFVHEFSHVMGLPDLYDTSSAGLTCTPNSWDVLDYGPYNNGARTPPIYSIYERNAMGWLEPEVIDGPADIVLENIHDSNKGYIINTENTNEFFLIENRQQTGWDTYLPGHGLLVWHIDFNQSVWDRNVVNNTRNHQYVDIVEANNNPSGNESAMAGYPFPGTARKTELSYTTTPSMRSWGGKDLGLPLSDITESNGVVSFSVAGGSVTPEAPAGLTVTGTTARSIALKWNAVAKAKDYLVSVYGLDASGNRVAVLTDAPTEGKTQYEVTGLEPETDYYASVRTQYVNVTSEACAEVSARTAELTFDYVLPVGKGAQNVSDKAFTATWDAVAGADEYFVTVTESASAEPKTVTADFGSSSSSISLPEGWSSTTAGDVYKSTTYCVDIPSLKMGKDNYTLTTAAGSDDVVGFGFWYRGATCSPNNSLTVEGLAGGDWMVLATIQPVPNTAEEFELGTAEIPAGVKAMRLVYHKVSSGNVAIDNVKLSTGGEVDRVLADYNRRSAGQNTSLDVTGVTPLEKAYRYTVTARQGNVYSLESVPVAVNKTNGVASAVGNTHAVSATVDGLELSVRAESGAIVRVTDMAGRTVATGRGSLTTALPAAGVYVVTVDGQAIKVVAGR